LLGQIQSQEVKEMKRRLWIVMLVLVALLAPTTNALAGNGGDDSGKVVFGGDFVLKEGERLDGDLAVFGGDVTLEPDSVVNGDLLVMGGSVTAAGEINGDVVIFGGNAGLEATAVVDGDVITLGGNISEAEGATVRGKTSQGFSFGFVPRVRMPRPPTVWWPWQSGANPVLGLFLRGLKALGTALVLALLALLVVSLWPKPTGLVANTVWRSPAASFGVGLLTLLVVAGLVVLLIITICLSPLLVLATAVAWLFGWIALGWLVGRRLLAALKAKNVASVWEAGIGVFLITLLGAVPCIGWLVWLVGGAFGLGAVVLTRFGSQRYDGTQPAPPPEPPGVLPAGPILPEEDEAPELPSVEFPSPEEDEVPELPSVELPSPEEDEAPELPSVELPSPEDGEPAGALLSDPSLPEPPEVASVEEVELD
jgi:hypothetical protein